jgi:large conductance mechanosensitive channel
MLNQFKEFITRGNVIELAVAVIMGSAFGAIVTSFVDDLFMPLIGVIIGGIDFTALSLNVGEESILYGNFIQAVVNFLLIAFALFILVRSVNRLQIIEDQATEDAPSEPTGEEKLLTEIRDLLKGKQ